jgi:hypothetical protein
MKTTTPHTLEEREEFDSSIEERLWKDFGYKCTLKGLNAVIYIMAYNDWLKEGNDDTPENFYEFVKDCDKEMEEEGFELGIQVNDIEVIDD